MATDSTQTKHKSDETEAKHQYDVDVVVVGAGPIGLTTACALRHHGVDCRIFEEEPKPKPYSRANNVWARGQELLDSVGLRGPLAENSYLIEKQTLFIEGKPLDTVQLDEVSSPFAKALYSGQDVIEKTLSTQAGSRGREVERARKVTDIAPDDDGVYVTIEDVSDGNGPKAPLERLRCRYLIGADGSEGTVRKAIGLEYTTERFDKRATRQIDAKLSWQRSTEPDQLWFFVYHNGFAGVLPIWGGYHRLFFLEDSDEMPDRKPTLEEMQAHGREITGDDTLTFSDPIWFSHGRFEHGVSPKYRVGNIFLAGDAGHKTLPIGGQGMNAGFHDAVGLAWRLAMALKGHATDVVLESYGGERQGQHEELDEKQAQGFEQLVYRNRLGDAALSLAGRTIPDMGSKIFGSDDLQQLSVSYRKSELNEEHLSGLLQGLHPNTPLAGDRAPDATVNGEDGEDVQLFSQIYNPDGKSWGWALLAFDGRKEGEGAALLAALGAVAGWDWVRPRLITAAPDTAGELAATSVPKLSDLDAAAHSAYGLDGTPALVLVRPDGHIAFRGAANKPEQLVKFCEKAFGKAKA